jgi:hypothetical protein
MTTNAPQLNRAAFLVRDASVLECRLFDRDGLGEVTWGVDGGTFLQRGVIAEHLHRNRVNDRRQHAYVARGADNMHAVAFVEVAVQIGKYE